MVLTLFITQDKMRPLDFHLALDPFSLGHVYSLDLFLSQLKGSTSYRALRNIGIEIHPEIVSEFFIHICWDKIIN